ncbi:RES family NAD+ phosphorylase [Ruegeria sp.]|uniref:RES family NAD+ phosphorylase n=1 Tax=Ruegeria sp. TaxID=1879320 RepID=UPI003B003308
MDTLKLLAITYVGTVFRAHNPRWSWSPLSGDGAAICGGRFNAIGMQTLYTSEHASTALLEASPLGRPFQPLTLISYSVQAEIIDACDRDVLAEFDASEAVLAYANWEEDMLSGRTPPQHELAKRLIEQGVQGMRVPSFARNATARDINLVFWDWSTAGATIRVIDDEGRLPRDQSSWL